MWDIQKENLECNCSLYADMFSCMHIIYKVIWYVFNNTETGNENIYHKLNIVPKLIYPYVQCLCLPKPVELGKLSIFL